MESKKIYEDSHDELVRIKKTITFDSFTINNDKLDGVTKDKLLRAINNVISERTKEIEKVILGPQ